MSAACHRACSKREASRTHSMYWPLATHHSRCPHANIHPSNSLCGRRMSTSQPQTRARAAPAAGSGMGAWARRAVAVLLTTVAPVDDLRQPAQRQSAARQHVVPSTKELLQCQPALAPGGGNLCGRTAGTPHHPGGLVPPPRHPASKHTIELLAHVNLQLTFHRGQVAKDGSAPCHSLLP